MKIMKTFIFSYLLLNSLIGFGQNSSKSIPSSTQNQQMIMEFINFKTDFYEKIENNYKGIKRGSTDKTQIEKLRVKNTNLKKLLDDKINEIALKYGVSKKELYLTLSEYYKKEGANKISRKK